MLRGGEKRENMFIQYTTGTKWSGDSYVDWHCSFSFYPRFKKTIITTTLLKQDIFPNNYCYRYVSHFWILYVHHSMPNCCTVMNHTYKVLRRTLKKCASLSLYHTSIISMRFWALYSNSSLRGCTKTRIKVSFPLHNQRSN